MRQSHYIIRRIEQIQKYCGGCTGAIFFQPVVCKETGGKIYGDINAAESENDAVSAGMYQPDFIVVSGLSN